MTAQRRTFWLVFLLALTLLVLATRAKLAQYGTGLVHAPQITKATKLVQGRQPLAHVPVAVISAARVLPGTLPEVAAPLAFAPEPLVFVTVFWGPAAVRPPPSLA